MPKSFHDFLGFPMTVKIIPLAISLPGVFCSGSNPISRAQARPKSGVYQRYPKMKFPTVSRRFERKRLLSILMIVTVLVLVVWPMTQVQEPQRKGRR